MHALNAENLNGKMGDTWCDEHFDDLTNTREVRQDKARLTFLQSAKQRKDEKLRKIFREIAIPFRIHKKCGVDYTRINTINADLERKHEGKYTFITH